MLGSGLAVKLLASDTYSPSVALASLPVHSFLLYFFSISTLGSVRAQASLGTADFHLQAFPVTKTAVPCEATANAGKSGRVPQIVENLRSAAVAALRLF